MKKAFCFSLIAIIIALASAPALVKADDVAVITPYVDTPTLLDSDREKYAQALFLTDYLRNGGTVDLSNTSSDYSTTDLLSDFGDFVYDVIGDIVDVINPFQSEFEWGNGFPLRPVSAPLNEFMGKLPFYALQPSDEPSYDVPEDYLPYIQKINDEINTGFFWKNYTFTGSGSPLPSVSPEPSTLSFYNRSNWVTISDNPIGDIVNGTGGLFVSSFITANISLQENNKYLCNISGYNPDIPQGKTSNGVYYIPYYAQESIFNNQNSSINSYVFNNNYRISLFNYEFDTLTNCFRALSSHFRNINIYVDGVPWSIVSTPQSYNIQLSTSTVTPQGERVRWMYDKEIYVDIDKILERLDEVLYEIQHTPNTPTIVKFDDLDDLIVDVNGTPALAVKVINNELSLDDRYSEDFGPIIPLFVPMFTPVINDSDIVTVTDVSTSALPDELLEVCGYVFVGTLFACFIHRLLE